MLNESGGSNSAVMRVLQEQPEWTRRFLHDEEAQRLFSNTPTLESLMPQIQNNRFCGEQVFRAVAKISVVGCSHPLVIWQPST
jgi:hypothetical protein